MQSIEQTEPSLIQLKTFEYSGLLLKSDEVSNSTVFTEKPYSFVCS